MDESVIEITPEERERIIANIKSNGALFVGSRVAKAIQANYNNNKECWNKLLTLIESAPVKKNMRAVELANKLEKSYDSTENVFTTLCDVLGYESTGITTEKDMKNLCEAIRNLDAPIFDLPLMLDKDGMPIKPGDTVYYKGRLDEDFIVEKIIIAENKSSKKEFSIEIVGVSKDKNRGYSVSPEEVTHNKPRTLNDILQDVPSNSFFGVQTWETVNNLIQEAYDLGLSEGAKKDE